ncbi:hypothetical protein VOLCADRAFT_107713 [Volvox carteri f. nagariensis]|uniref:TNase-like domain-containing protein n=1 Tax=Volvox carteri f. nagariensis TaxID=3068 RepID=D8UFT0_VOLCA|nr:uncharacterized protein VOLCADRAFT_107713 [Volvox carteri f. nagariensis]EFJ41433.1 hypothetical protein VOLCADRAFT_107713 [Volvox carteri f. nagariensis]|eukprot:XP_002957539.1 hypothetical protein VOLCADRAFT_107713 [Volvox carteri f. nagariensis]
MAQTMRMTCKHAPTTITHRERASAFKPVCKLSQDRKMSIANAASAAGRTLLAGFASCIVLTSGAVAAPSVIEGPARVVDGDTLVINGERIRLYGVDAPESAQQCSDARGASYPCGLVSKDALAKKVGSSPVACDVKNTDMYGRNVSVCNLKSVTGAEELNSWLVSNGYAVAYREYSKEYVPLEDAAHTAGKGVWQGQFQVPSEWRKANKRSEVGPVAAAVAYTPAAGAAAANGGDPVPQCANGPAIKGNINSNGQKIYHMPSGKFYDSVRIDLKDGERFFCTETEAKAAGWRPSMQ